MLCSTVLLPILSLARRRQFSLVQLVCSYFRHMLHHYCHSRRSLVNFIKVWFLDEETQMNPNLKYAQLARGPDGQIGQHTGTLYAPFPPPPPYTGPHHF